MEKFRKFLPTNRPPSVRHQSVYNDKLNCPNDFSLGLSKQEIITWPRRVDVKWEIIGIIECPKSNLRDDRFSKKTVIYVKRRRQKKATKIAILNKFNRTIQQLNLTCLFKIISKRSHDCQEEGKKNASLLLCFLEFRFAAGMTLNVTLSFIFSSRLLRDSVFLHHHHLATECCLVLMNNFGIRHADTHTQTDE